MLGYGAEEEVQLLGQGFGISAGPAPAGEV